MTIKLTKNEAEFLAYIVHTYEINDIASENEQKSDLKLQTAISKKIMNAITKQ